MQDYHVINTTQDDLPQIIEFFEASILYQEKKGSPVWRNYDQRAIAKDIQDKNHYKIVIDGVTAIVFSVRYSDKLIWRELENNTSLYLHRIVVNPGFKGRKLFGKIMDWCIAHCRQANLSHIRMDTWAANYNIIEYYKTFGFKFVENYTTPDTEELPVHNRNLEIALLDYPIE